MGDKPNTAAPAKTAVAMDPKTKLMLVGVVALLVGFGIGYGVGMKARPAGTGGDYQAGYDAAKKKLSDSGVFPKQGEALSISGPVQEVGADYVQVQVGQLVRNPLDAQAPTTRKVLVGTDTKILLLTERTAEEYTKARETFAAAQKEYLEATAAGKTPKPPQPPSRMAEQDIKLSDIKAGDNVLVDADKDITMAESFTAKAVRVTRSVPMTNPAPDKGTIQPPPPPADIQVPPPVKK